MVYILKAWQAYITYWSELHEELDQVLDSLKMYECDTRNTRKEDND